MSSLCKDVCSKVHPSYHTRVKEILLALDFGCKYEIRTTKNLTTLKHLVSKLLGDYDGYTNLNPVITTLNGRCKKVADEYKFEGDFIVLLIKNRLLNPNTGATKMVNVLVIYEKSEDVFRSLRGGISC